MSVFFFFFLDGWLCSARYIIVALLSLLFRDRLGLTFFVYSIALSNILLDPRYISPLNPVLVLVSLDILAS